MQKNEIKGKHKTYKNEKAPKAFDSYLAFQLSFKLTLFWAGKEERKFVPT